MPPHPVQLVKEYEARRQVLSRMTECRLEQFWGLSEPLGFQARGREAEHGDSGLRGYGADQHGLPGPRRSAEENALTGPQCFGSTEEGIWMGEGEKDAMSQLLLQVFQSPDVPETLLGRAVHHVLDGAAPSVFTLKGIEHMDRDHAHETKHEGYHDGSDHPVNPAKLHLFFCTVIEPQKYGYTRSNRTLAHDAKLALERVVGMM